MLRILKKRIREQTFVLSDLQNISVLEELVFTICEKLNGSPLLCGRILVAVKEAFANAVVHGNKGDANKYIFVSFETNDIGYLEVEIEDEGTGFDYMGLWSPISYDNGANVFSNANGLFLMKTLSDSLSYNNKGNRVKMTFQCYS